MLCPFFFKAFVNVNWFFNLISKRVYLCTQLTILLYISIRSFFILGGRNSSGSYSEEGDSALAYKYRKGTCYQKLCIFPMNDPFYYFLRRIRRVASDWVFIVGSMIPKGLLFFAAINLTHRPLYFVTCKLCRQRDKLSC